MFSLMLNVLWMGFLGRRDRFSSPRFHCNAKNKIKSMSHQQITDQLW